MRVCVIGGGIAGLSAAYYAAVKGHEVTIIEKEEFGGLASTFPVAGTVLEKFYHHFFSTDAHLINLAKDLGIDKKIHYYKSTSGFYMDGRILPFSTPFDIFRFNALSPMDRLRLIGVMMAMRLRNDWRGLDNVKISAWHKRYGCGAIYEKVWAPLLRLKFSKASTDISMAWLWGRINPRSKSRSGIYEMLGYFDKGGFQLLLDSLVKDLRKRDVTMLEGKTVQRIETKGKKITGITIDGKSRKYDEYISTIPLPLLKKMLPLALSKGNDIEYQGIITLITVSKRKFTGIYWLNVCDKDIPFGGVIGHTNLTGTNRYGGSHLTYFLNYLPNDHPYFSYSDKRLFETYFPAMQKISPHIRRKDITKYFVFKERYASPIYRKGFSCAMPSIDTNYKNLRISTMANIYPEDRNVSNGIGISKKAIESLND